MDEAQKEADYKKILAENGVDLPKEEVEEPKPELEKEPAKEPEAAPEKEPEKPLVEEPKVERKRTIYDDYKEKKAEVKSEREAREEAEHERDELKRQLESLQDPDRVEKKEDPKDVLEYATEKGADPELVRRIIDEARANQPKLDPEISQRLDRFESWQKQNAHVLEKQMFDEEFAQAAPKLKELFPGATAEELTAMKPELDKLSHSKEMHDKELDYVAFKNREHLSTLISPHKRGMESKGRNQVEDNSFEFDPSADLSRMNFAQQEAWNKMYQSAVATEKEKLHTSAGKRIIL